MRTGVGRGSYSFFSDGQRHSSEQAGQVAHAASTNWDADVMVRGEPRAKHEADASIMARILNEGMGSCVSPS